MVSRNWTLLFGIAFLALLEEVTGNGRLLVPPQRSSLWRDPAFQRNRKVVRNYDDHTLNCGGFWKMHENDGKCGICGDAWDDEEPRANEAGGMYARGIIGRTYSTDKRYIDALVQITSSIAGYFEFNICPNDDVKTRVSRECLEQFPLRILSKDRSISYGRRYFPDITAGLAGIVELSLELPDGLECTQCVLQWRWHGANNYGICRNGRWGKGCGEQPEMYNCADIAILPENGLDKKNDRPHDKKNDRPNKRPAVTTTTQKTTTTQLTSTTSKTTTVKETPSMTTITSTVKPIDKETTAVASETTTPDNSATQPGPEPEPTTVQQPITTQTTVQQPITTQTTGQQPLTQSTVGQTTTQTESISTSTVGQSTTEIVNPTSVPLDTGKTEPTTRTTVQHTTTETTSESSPDSTTRKMEHSTTTPIENITVVPEKVTTMSLSGDNNVTELTSTKPTQTSTRSLIDQTSTSSATKQTTAQTTSSPDIYTTKMDVSSEARRNRTAMLTTTSRVSISTETEQLTTPIADKSTVQQEHSSQHSDTTVTFTVSPTSPTTSSVQSSITSQAAGTTQVSETVDVKDKSLIPTELKTTTESNQLKDVSTTGDATGTSLTTAGNTTASTGQEKSTVTTSSLAEVSQFTTSTIADMSQATTTKKVLTTAAPEERTSTQTEPAINTGISKSTMSTPSIDQSNDLSTSSITSKQTVITTESINNQTLPSDGSSTEASLIKLTTSSMGSTDMPTTLTTTSFSEGITESERPLVKGNIITNTDKPTASETDVSLVDLLNELSKLENVTSNELIDALSISVNDNSSSINVNRSSPSTVINTTSFTENVTTTGSTTKQATNDNNKSPTTTQTPEIDNISTTKITTVTGGKTNMPDGTRFETNIVTSRTTRIVQPTGGRFGGGISVAKLTPVDQIVNIDLNIPGGDANIEKEKNRMNEGL